MSDLVGNPEDRFSRVEAHLIPRIKIDATMLTDAIKVKLLKAVLLKVCLTSLKSYDRTFIIIVSIQAKMCKITSGITYCYGTYFFAILC